MYTQTIIAVVVIWVSVAAIIGLSHHLRRRLAYNLLIEVWYMLEEMRTNDNLDMLWVNKYQTAYDALLDIADSVHPSIGIKIMEHIEFSQWLHQHEKTDQT